ncbi:hypothetical protein FHR24_002343 [Wenyingzhuangia heitensis]|uniref:Fibronectin type-III domain-containing protein n=1 Tax=Wenyingzhuangia heitensis TaxID=1487859 RepID=A0ABX0UFT4_9FLAO|nr:fibronectin type III domain-containing protein [Wenyingzhuangia heitensis]NIJ45872.1 hypothetical protein [Wenyingzhuangia heitensis]
MKNIKNLAIGLILLIAISCGGNKDSEEMVLEPQKAVLVYPAENEECEGGIVVSDTEAVLEFKWQKAENADSYLLKVESLNTGVVKEFTANTNFKEVNLLRGVPYSWSVVSLKKGSQITATSSLWEFYMAAEGVENYIPFPAKLLNPTNEEIIVTSSVTIEWSGNDVDNDIKEYELYLDTNSNPTTKHATTNLQTVENISLITGTTYYWKVVTKDLAGNSSNSQVYSFTLE